MLELQQFFPNQHVVDPTSGLRQRVAMQDAAVVRIEHDEATTLLTIDRPKALNALTSQVVSELRAAFDALPAQTRVVILTGAGDRAFVAGGDIKSMAAMSPAEAEAFARQGHALGKCIEDCEVPVIAAVNGFALGGGCELLLACDFAIASERARFGQPEVGLGVIPGFGGTTRLGRRVGDARARQLLLTGAQFGADDALAWGLVNEVVSPDQLMPRVREIAAQIIKNAPRAVAYAKRSARIAEEADLATANAFETHVFGLCFTTDDRREGMHAFIEKRAPSWTGN